MTLTVKQGLTVLLAAALLSPLPVEAQAYTTILLYHRVGEERYPSTSIPVEAFREQMAWLASHDYRVIPLAELVSALQEGHAPPPHSVVITFDDTYRSIYDLAAPILAEHGYPYSLFVYTKAMEDGYSDFMTWDQLRELVRRPGVEIGNHSHDHAHWVHRDGKTLSPEALRRDVAMARTQIVEHLGVTPAYYAFPYGEYTPEAQAIVRAAGYRVQLTQDRGSVGAETLLHQLPRNALVGSRGTLDTLREVVNEPPLPWQSRQPATGRLPGKIIGEVAVRLSHPGRYSAGEVNLFVSELGRVDCQFDPTTGWVRAEVTTPLSRPFNRITVSARQRADNHWALSSWMVMTGE